jgi:hypothetical protein
MAQRIRAMMHVLTTRASMMSFNNRVPYANFPQPRCVMDCRVKPGNDSGEDFSIAL